MSIKIKLTTEGNRREPYVVEIEVGQDTIVASLDLIHAITSAGMASKEVRESFASNAYAWGITLMEMMMGKRSIKSGSGSAPPWIMQGKRLDLPPDISDHIMETVVRYMNKVKQQKDAGNKLIPNKFDFSSLFSEDKIEPPDDEPQDKADKDKNKKEP